MKSMDIINAMSGIDPELVQDAKRPVKRAPAWLKWTSIAACVCCLIGAAALSLGHIFQNTEAEGPAESHTALTSVEEPRSMEESTEEQEAEASYDEELETIYPSDSEDVVVQNNKYGVSLLIPDSNATLFSVNLPLTSEVYDEVDQDNIAFSFFDHETTQFDDGGFLWSIAVYPLNEYGWSELEQFENETYVLNKTVLGTNDTHVFELIYPDISRQFDYQDYEASQNYFDKLITGLEVLTDFVDRNGLTSDGTWKKTYIEKTATSLFPLYSQLIFSTDVRTLNSYTHSVSISCRTSAAGNVYTDTAFSHKNWPELVYKNAVFTLYSPDSADDDHEGFVWSILAYPKAEYTTASSAQDDENTVFHTCPIGSDDEYVYELLYPGSGLDYATNSNSIDAYYSHVVYGYEMLKSFVSENDIVSDDQWEYVYITQMLGEILDMAIITAQIRDYTEADIAAAKAVVTDYFDREFTGCTLIDLWYDEGQTYREWGNYIGQEGAEKVLVLRCDFEVDESGGDGSLNPNSTYSDWGWHLVWRDEGWEIVNYGYG